VRQAATTSLERLTTPFKKGYVPPGAINWGDVDNNNAFFRPADRDDAQRHISIAAAQMASPIFTTRRSLPAAFPSAMMASWCRACWRFPPHHPKGSKNVDAAKALLRDFIQPANMNAYLKETRARYLPVHDLHREERSVLDRPEGPAPPGCGGYGLVKPTVPWWMSYNPRLFGCAIRADLGAGGSQYHAKQHDPAQATEEAAKRIKQLFEQYQK